MANVYMKIPMAIPTVLQLYWTNQLKEKEKPQPGRKEWVKQMPKRIVAEALDNGLSMHAYLNTGKNETPYR